MNMSYNFKSKLRQINTFSSTGLSVKVTIIMISVLCVSFMPMGSYLLFTGILLSARLVARDKELRMEFYNTAMSQMSLLRTIGVTEMERQLMKGY